jgi:hypothetical protein
MIKICKPFKGYNKNLITQGFSLTHKAVDFTSSWGTFLVAPFNCKITGIVDGGKLGETSYIEGGCGVRMVSVEDPKISVLYWHCLSIFPVNVGEIVWQGKPVAQMGNTGYVLSNGNYVPIDKRFIFPFLGTHCHCTMNINGSEQDGLVDITKYIDENIEIKYDLKTTISSIISKIINIIK